MLNKNVVTRIHDKHYDLTNFNHPGGPIALSLADNRDATGLFISHHPFVAKDRLAAIMKKYEFTPKEGEEIEKDIYFDYEKESPFAKEVVANARQYFQRIADKKGISITRATKANTGRYMEYLFLLVCYVVSMYYWFAGHWWAFFVWPFALWELSIHSYHDACHFAVTYNWRFNFLIPYIVAPVLVSPLDWYHQHNIGHHVHTDIAWKDPDLAHAPKLYRVHKSIKWRAAHKDQVWKTPLIWAIGLPIGMALVAPLRSMFTKLYNRTVPYVRISQSRWFLHVLGRVLAIAMWVWPYFYFNFWKALIWTPLALYQMSAYFMCSSQVSHLTHAATNMSSRDWHTHQVLTSLGYGHKSWWVWFHSGGLNFQAEHHLFPNINHCHHKYLQPIVEATCKKHGVRYLQAEGYIDALKMHFDHIINMGKNKVD
mmetsp:Transcript_61825/g.70927  ORF Transcript_61825/g.70927 Transcript_61825/m.70927 type:complete len:426 (+) Transcript_61825:130-1407(+)